MNKVRLFVGGSPTVDSQKRSVAFCELFQMWPFQNHFSPLNSLLGRSRSTLCCRRGTERQERNKASQFPVSSSFLSVYFGSETEGHSEIYG